MPSGPVTSRVLIVTPIAHVPLINDTLALVDPTSAGEVLRVPLRLAGDLTNTVAARWASWAMDDATRSDWNAAFGRAKWVPRPTTSEVTVYQPGQAVPTWGLQRMYLFDGLTWVAGDVLRLLGLDLMLPEEE